MFKVTRSLLALVCLSLLLSSFDCQNAPVDNPQAISANTEAAQANANNATANSNAAQGAAAAAVSNSTAAGNAAAASANDAAANNQAGAANNAAAAQSASNNATANAAAAQAATNAANNNTAAANNAAGAATTGAAGANNAAASNDASNTQAAASNATAATANADNATAAAQNAQGAAANSAVAANNSASSTVAVPAAAAVVAPAATAVAAPATNATAPGVIASNITQGPYPPSNLSLYIVEPFFYSDDVNNQIVGHLFCNTDGAFNVTQCAVYDTYNAASGRLLAIEYMINETQFNGLPANEKRFWHSHAYGVQSGDIFAPDIPAGDDYTATLSFIANSYGKTVYLWSQTQSLPIGDPILAFGFTAPGQLNSTAGAAEDSQFNTTLAQRVANNANVTIPTVAAGADSWDVTGVIPVFTDINQTLPANLWGLTFPPQAQ